jgi:hypothetical protein
MSLITKYQSSSALDAIKGQGINVPNKPDYTIPSLPVDLTEVGDEDLMVLYGKLTAYADFITVQVSCAQIDERAMERRLANMEATKMLGSSGKSENRVTFARAQVATDPEVLTAKTDIEEIHAYRKLVEALANNIERDAALVSRELTRRTSTVNRRSARWSA